MIACTKRKSHYLILIIFIWCSNTDAGTELQSHTYKKIDHQILSPPTPPPKRKEKKKKEKYHQNKMQIFLLISKSLISERKKPCGPKMIVLVRIPQAQNSGTQQPTSKVNGQTSNMTTGTELVVLGDSYFFESATFTIPFPHSDSDSER